MSDWHNRWVASQQDNEELAKQVLVLIARIAELEAEVDALKAPAPAVKKAKKGE